MNIMKRRTSRLLEKKKNQTKRIIISFNVYISLNFFFVYHMYSFMISIFFYFLSLCLSYTCEQSFYPFTIYLSLHSTPFQIFFLFIIFLFIERVFFVDRKLGVFTCIYFVLQCLICKK